MWRKSNDADLIWSSVSPALVNAVRHVCKRPQRCQFRVDEACVDPEDDTPVSPPGVVSVARGRTPQGSRVDTQASSRSSCCNVLLVIDVVWASCNAAWGSCKAVSNCTTLCQRFHRCLFPTTPRCANDSIGVVQDAIRLESRGRERYAEGSSQTAQSDTSFFPRDAASSGDRATRGLRTSCSSFFWKTTSSWTRCCRVRVAVRSSSIVKR